MGYHRCYSTNEIVRFAKDFYGIKLHWWQKLELWLFQKRYGNKHWYYNNGIMWRF